MKRASPTFIPWPRVRIKTREEGIFRGREDYLQFMDLAQEGSTMWNVGIAALCLMPNHCHVLVRTPNVNDG